MVETKSVSVLVIGAYVTFVVGSSLLVGLLPPYVNRPTCKTDKANLKFDHHQVQPIIDEPSEIENNNDLKSDLLKNIDYSKFNNLVRSKRQSIQNDKFEATNKLKKNIEKKKKELENKQIPDLNQRIANLKNSNPAFVESIKSRYDIEVKDGYKICPEILTPSSQAYPWYERRLPGDVFPVNYDIAIRVVKDSSFQGYIGSVEITVNVARETNYFLLHNKIEYDIPLLQYVTDRNGKNITIDCVGEFAPNDYYVFKTVDKIQPSQSPLKIKFDIIEYIDKNEQGIFVVNFGKTPRTSQLLVSKFEPLDARYAFPCFDEPMYKATYNFQIGHPKDTKALFNTDSISETNDNNYVVTKFKKTPPMPTYMIGFVVFNTTDFSYKEQMSTDGNTRIRVWALNDYVNEGYAEETLNMTKSIYDSLKDLFRLVNESSFAEKIDFFAIPDYPVDAVPHFGLPIFKDSRVLFNSKSASERDKQTIALLIAKNLAEFWFGNYVTFGWWNELWLQEALSDFIKYRVVELAYPEYNIYSQFITEELIYALVNDAYPSSHPIQKEVSNQYEIEEYFDEVESSKAAAIIRMVEEIKDEESILNGLTGYLNQNPWGTGDINVFYQNLGLIANKWNAKDFFKRWTTQANYPVISVRLVDEPDNRQSINIYQKRALNSESSIFAGELLYPSEFDFVWYIPVTCSFGTGPQNSDKFHQETFLVETRNFTARINSPHPNTSANKFRWVHCNRKFDGYYEVDYTRDNWERLGQALRAKNNELIPEDRANIIHNIFTNGFTERQTYYIVRDVVSYIYGAEKDYLPWKTLSKHLNDLLSVLDYKQTFYPVAEYFNLEMRNVLEELDPWNPAGFHVEELLKETIIDLACRLQNVNCFDKAAQLWEIAKPSLFSQEFDNSILPPYVREVVFNYHVQNTYDVDNIFYIIQEYEATNDLLLQRKILEALSYSRQPWILATYIQLQREDELNHVNFFESIKLLSKNTLGRELIWDYFRSNYIELLDEYGLDDSRLGQAIIDISSSFENEFLFYELIEFIYESSELTGATANARFRALEIVSTTVVWLYEKEEEIFDAFKFESNKNVNFDRSKNDSLLVRSEESKKNLREKIQKKLNEYLMNVKLSKSSSKSF